MIKITDKLEDAIEYDSETGELYWKKTVHSRAEKGTRLNNVTKSGYIRFQYLGKKYYAHRVAYFLYHGTEPTGYIDHINGIRVDNRIENLRDVTKFENQKNTKRPITNTSGVIGVHWCKNTKRWISQIGVDCEKINLGRFDKFSDAVNARKNAEVLYGFHENHGR